MPVSETKFPYVYFWNRMDRKGQRCAVTARGYRCAAALRSRHFPSIRSMLMPAKSQPS